MRVKNITLSPYSSFGEQLKPYRKAAKLTLAEMSVLMQCDLTNICHFEKGSRATGNSIHTAIKYCKALGINKIIIKIV